MTVDMQSASTMWQQGYRADGDSRNLKEGDPEIDNEASNLSIRVPQSNSLTEDMGDSEPSEEWMAVI